MCSCNIEDYWHLFYACPFANACMLEANILNVVDQYTAISDNFTDLIFHVLEHANEVQRKKVVVILSTIWKCRNHKVWRNEVKSAKATVFAVLDNFYDWLRAIQLKCSCYAISIGSCAYWHRPPEGFFKCNVDAAIDSNANMARIGLVIRNDVGMYVLSQLIPRTGCWFVREAECYGVLKAIKWLRSDAKVVVDALYSFEDDASEFGLLLHQCKELL
ncbi:hypothetical protein DITRI_Ditri10aG0075700 [Diplodiscus trichospermus]